MKEVTEAEKAKAAYQFRCTIVTILDDAYPMYGYKQQNPEVAEVILEAALLLAKRYRGRDVPITKESAVAKLNSRR